jgi:hypothetical protein
MMRRSVSLVAAGLLLHAAVSARATPLDKDGCAKLKVEQGELEHAGTRASMSKGPQWAKTNLEPDKLEQIRRLLEVDEQLQFRCNGKSLVHLPKDPELAPAAQAPGSKAGATPKGPKAKAQKKEPRKKAASAEPTTKAAVKQEPTAKAPAPAAAAVSPAATPAAGNTQGGEAKGAHKSASAKKTKAKAKDDAYHPPDPGASPFDSKP